MEFPPVDISISSPCPNNCAHTCAWPCTLPECLCTRSLIQLCTGSGPESLGRRWDQLDRDLVGVNRMCAGMLNPVWSMTRRLNLGGNSCAQALGARTKPVEYARSSYATLRTPAARRFARRLWTEDGMRIDSRYFATVRLAMSMPSAFSLSTIMSSDSTMSQVSASII